MTAKRYNEGKPEMWYWMMWPKAAEAFARVCEYGGRKYDELNFTKGGKPDKEYLSAAIRHLLAHMCYVLTRNGRLAYDDESKCLHLAHAMWNIMMLIDYNMKDMKPTVDSSDTVPGRAPLTAKEDFWSTEIILTGRAQREGKQQEQYDGDLSL